ncbi:hypothetical protein DH2020_000500 [Rehmannia glutinosa]|uniref:Aluminum-activated malate transporter 2-like n=1 Tax=Rehmannia glutinosa TaxID=99300 RepID=A0ABR0XX47_REHGL
MASENQENVRGLKRVGVWFKGCLEKIMNVVTNAAKDAKKLGEEDPRRVVHSLKVGLAITVVSLFYYFDFLYQGFGVNAMWAVMTVVVVFEFSVATMVTFMRFFPKLKARYDYGLLIFILTFSLISVSGYRDDEVLDMAHRRLSTILIGGSATVFICIFICPVWAGADLHKITASNIEKLGIFLEGFGRVYFQLPNDKNSENQASMDEYKTVLNSKGIEDTLVNFAKWEPRHGKFRYRHPWDQYLKIGSLTRECAYKFDALNGYLNSDVQTPVEIGSKIQESCTMMSSECSCALRELAMGIKTMTRSLSADIHIVKAKTSAKKLKSLLKTGLWPDTDIFDIIPAVTVASLLIEIVSCTVKIADSVHELASLSKFKTPDEKMIKQLSLERVKRTPSIEGSHSFSVVVE